MGDIGGIGSQMNKLQTKLPQRQSGLSNTRGETANLPSNSRTVSHDKNYINQSRNGDFEKLRAKLVQPPVQDGKNLTEILKGSGALQKLNKFAGMGRKILSNALTDLDLRILESQAFTGKDMDELLTFIKQHPENKIVQGAVTNFLRSFLSEQKAKRIKSTIQSIVDELVDVLNTIESEDGDGATPGNKPNGAIEANLKTKVGWLNADPSSDTFRGGLSELIKSLPNDSKALDAITRLINAINTLDETKHFDISSSVNNLHALLDQLDEGDEMFAKFQKPLALSEKLLELTKMSNVLGESDEALEFISKLKELYSENATIQSLTVQILQGKVVNEQSDQAMFHLILKSLFNGQLNSADVWVESEGEEDCDGTWSVVKLMMATELDGVGNFEVELKLLNGKSLAIDVQCPEDYVDEMKGIRELVTDQVHSSGYSVPNISVGVFEEKVKKEDSSCNDTVQRGDFIAKV